MCGSTSHYILHLASINNVLFIFLAVIGGQVSSAEQNIDQRLLFERPIKINGVFRLAIALIYNVSNFPRPSLLGWLQEHEASDAVHE